MDHRLIDEQQVAERYVTHTLGAAERAAFEAHLVDCQECADRLLLAEMFHARNGASKAARTASFQLPPQEIIDVGPQEPGSFQHGWRSVATFLALATLAAALVCAIAAYWLRGR
jgi:anti-sigma factor RsiW